MAANSSVTQEEVQTLNGLLHLPAEAAQRVLVETLAARPELDGALLQRQRLSTRPALLGEFVLGPKTGDVAIPTAPVLNFGGRFAKPWVLATMSSGVLLAGIGTCVRFKLDMPRYNPVIGTIACLFMVAFWITLLENANAHLFKEFVISFDFAMVVASVWRVVVACIINHGESLGFNNPKYHFWIFRQTVYALTTLLFAASIDVVCVTRHRWAKKVAISLCLALAIASYLLAAFSEGYWLDESFELPIWFVSLNARKQCLAGLSSLCIFIGKFFFQIVVLDQPFANKRIDVMVKQRDRGSFIEIQHLDSSEARVCD